MADEAPERSTEKPKDIPLFSTADSLGVTCLTADHEGIIVRDCRAGGYGRIMMVMSREAALGLSKMLYDATKPAPGEQGR